MKQFNNLLKRYLTECNSKLIVEECSVIHEQFVITEKKKVFYIFLENKIIGHAKSLIEAKQLCDTINSGC